MTDMNIKISEEDAHHISLSKNRRAKLARIRKITGISAATIYNYIDTIDHTLETCPFCFLVKSFRHYDFEIRNGTLYLTDIKYKSQICSRKDISCEGSKLNPNSIEYVRIAHGFSTDKEANEYILSRNSSPFYRTNYNSDEEYSNAQRRDADFYGSEEKFKEIITKIRHSSKKETQIEKHGLAEYERVCASKDSMSKDHHVKKIW